MLKVVHLQKRTTSAGKAALRLHSAFLEAGINSNILSVEPDINDSETTTVTGSNSRLVVRMDYNLQTFFTRHAEKRYGQYSFPFFGTNISKHQLVRDADVIYLHWVQGGFLNLSNYRQLAQLKKPVIIFMHDMWSITGGCHHSFSCENYKSRCINCPVFPKKSLFNLPVLEFDRKRKLYAENDNFYFVSPSRWLFNCARESKLTKEKPVYYIPNAFNDKNFQPVDKNDARNVLNLEKDHIIIAFGAVRVDGPYKGWKELQKSLEILHGSLDHNKVTVLVFGSNIDHKILEGIPFRTKFMGFLKDEYSMSLIYNASDVLIAPSLAETFGYVVMESLSCGTPVVAFNVGGIPDLIKHKSNGYLAKYQDPADIANGVTFCLENKIKGYLLPEFRESVINRHLELLNAVTGK
jgi:glycosyltransferase involved in cell wall biosynthesis